MEIRNSDISIDDDNDLEAPFDESNESFYSSPKPSPQDAQKRHFFDLPLEVRTEIYSYAIAPGKIHIRSLSPSHHLDESDQSQPQLPNMALLRACRRIHEESHQVFYRDNIFSITHPDILQSTIGTDALVSKHLEYMHRVEIVFNRHDFEYMRGPFENKLRIGALAMNRGMSEKTSKKILMLRANMLGAEQYSAESWMSPESDCTGHDRAIQALYDCVFDRSLLFVRQKLFVTELHVDMTDCLCLDGCCRLAGEVMIEGLDMWTFGLPNRISICGATEEEQEKVLDSISQYLHGN